MDLDAGLGDAWGACLAALRGNPRRWLVTGSAGFIGSHLVETLLRLGQVVVGVDDFSTGRRQNLDEVRAAVGPEAWGRHAFKEGDIVDPAVCAAACESVDVVLHEAALGSVPQSLADPLRTHAVNATGFLNILIAARDAGVRRFVYAGSSAAYGDHEALPHAEDATGRPLSPYAATKQVDELYAGVFSRCFGLSSIGLRYFNVFGPRQDPGDAYAAVVPRWIAAMLAGAPATIHGDGTATRDFCFVADVVQANLLAATTSDDEAVNQVYNVGTGERLSLRELSGLLRDLVRAERPDLGIPAPVHAALRHGDIPHSQADISKARRRLGYAPTYDVRTGLLETLAWHRRRAAGGVG